jgi:hypothetical protein
VLQRIHNRLRIFKVLKPLILKAYLGNSAAFDCKRVAKQFHAPDAGWLTFDQGLLDEEWRSQTTWGGVCGHVVSPFDEDTSAQQFFQTRDLLAAVKPNELRRDWTLMPSDPAGQVTCHKREPSKDVGPLR